MGLHKYLVIAAYCLGFGIAAVAQNNLPPRQQQQPNDYGVAGDTGEEADQPVNHSATNLSPADNMETAWQMLGSGAKDSKEQMGIAALNAIGTLTGIKRAEDDLQEAIKDQNVDVRVAAVMATGSMKDEKLIPVLRQLLDDPTPEVVFAAAVALWKLHDPSGINILYGVLAGERKTKVSVTQTGKRQASKDLQDPGTLAKIGARTCPDLMTSERIG